MRGHIYHLVWTYVLVLSKGDKHEIVGVRFSFENSWPSFLDFFIFRTFLLTTTSRSNSMHLNCLSANPSSIRLNQVVSSPLPKETIWTFCPKLIGKYHEESFFQRVFEQYEHVPNNHDGWWYLFSLGIVWIIKHSYLPYSQVLWQNWVRKLYSFEASAYSLVSSTLRSYYSCILQKIFILNYHTIFF